MWAGCGSQLGLAGKVRGCCRQERERVASRRWGDPCPSGLNPALLKTALAALGWDLAVVPGCQLWILSHQSLINPKQHFLS